MNLKRGWRHTFPRNFQRDLKKELKNEDLNPWVNVTRITTEKSSDSYPAGLKWCRRRGKTQKTREFPLIHPRDGHTTLVLITVTKPSKKQLKRRKGFSG